MLDINSPNHVFRFTQLRPASAVGAQDAVELQDDTAIAVRMIGLPPQQRVAAARAHLDDARASVDNLLTQPWAERLVAVGLDIMQADGSVGDLQEAAQGLVGGTDLRNATTVLSDFLLASAFSAKSTIGWATPVVQLYRTATVAADSDLESDSRLAPLLRRAIVMPRALAGSRTDRTPAARREQVHDRQVVAAVTAPAWSGQVQDTIREVLSLYQTQVAQRIATGGNGNGHGRNGQRQSTALEPQTASRVSAASKKVLRHLGVDLTARSLVASVSELEAGSANPPAQSDAPSAPPAPASAPSALAVAEVRAAGIADLLVVKQHLKAYRRTDIAHVENVLAGERRERVHRNLERTEQTFVTERETTEEKESELQSAEKFELNQETQKTIQRDQKLGFGLTISGKYGPTVEFSSNVEADLSQSTQESSRSAVTYAKEVMERSVQRVTERVREEQTLKLIRETEETNTHELNNKGATHNVGIYQFLEKEYESQIFNYGIRQMFDFMVPEPASYLWHLESMPGAELALPERPPKLSDHVASAAEVHGSNYMSLGALMGAKGLEPPPPLVKLSSVAIRHGDSGDEGGQPQSVVDKDIAIPAGYVPWTATARPLALTDDELTLAITIGTDTQVYSPRGGAVHDLGGLDLGTTELDFVLVTSLSSGEEPQSKLAFHVVAYESNTYSVVANVLFVRTNTAYEEWQLKMYDALAQAANEQQAKYDQMVADLKARADAEAARASTAFDSPPSEHLRVVKAELKKHCLSIVTKQWYDAANGMISSDPPTFDLTTAASRGAFIRFFEQAFEWDQLQFVCYPYFWARKDLWASRFRRTEVDPTFLEFLQAGAARVVVPVRPGFEAALLYFLETLDMTGTGVVWNGAGSPPPISSPLYVSVIKEIQERTGAPQGEFPVGDPWTTILPTPLVILRADDSLPKWKRQSPTGWDWDETA